MAYDLSVVPTNVLIDGQGNIVETILGPVGAEELEELVRELTGS